MASSRSSVIQFSDEKDAQSELRFQDFSLAESSSGVATLSPSGTYNNFPESPDSHENESEDVSILLLGDEKKEESSFWKFSYYQSFFDIETVDFLERLKWSFIPVFGRATFLDRQIRPKPDLYGPFWITFCLIYSMAIMSNVANYFNGAVHEKKDWTFNFHRVSLSATAIYAYVFGLPLIIWGLLKHFQYSNRYTLLEIICVYGYSLAIFVPISIFWIFDAAWLHWILVTAGISLTGIVLLQIFWPIFRDDNKKTGTVLLCAIIICHILLGIGFGTLFFQERVDWVSTTTTTTIPGQTSSTTIIALVKPDSLKISRSINKEENTNITTAIKNLNSDEHIKPPDRNDKDSVKTIQTEIDVSKSNGLKSDNFSINKLDSAAVHKI